jgi:hypothetical protein
VEQPETPAFPPRYGDTTTAILFAVGALITSVFSGSLTALTSDVGLVKVLAVGMIVPSFTWWVQLVASSIWLDHKKRQLYWAELARICVLGSVVLLPGAFANLVAPHPPLWRSQPAFPMELIIE